MGPETLAQVLRPLTATFGALATPDLLVGLGTADDAAVFRLRPDLLLVATVDFFPPVVDDPATYGAIAVTNALGDVYAMGGRPLLALNIVAFPDTLESEILTDILRGGAEQAQRAGVIIAGGHTVIDPEPKYGLAVIGTVAPDDLLRKGGALPGDVLVLTKAIGTGILTTAHKRELIRPDGPELAHAIQSMTMLIGPALAVAQTWQRSGQAHVHAGTDVTGFGLLGHLWEMLTADPVLLGARVFLDQVPLLPGARELAKAGSIPGGTGRNLSAIAPHTRWTRGDNTTDQALLGDPQTAGGLLLALPADDLPELLAAYQAAGIAVAHIGTVTDSGMMEVV